MAWTKAQEETIDKRGCNILVSAAAGSGKTAVLIERIKKLIINDGIEIDKFLITTFTNAAAAEMKERLEKSIRAELEGCVGDREKTSFLRRQLELLPTSNIGTFHSFAIEILKRYFYVVGIDPGFRIADDIETSILKKESISEVFEEYFEEDFESFKEFLSKYSSDRNERRIMDNIISIYDEMRSIPDYMTWAKRQSEILKEESPCMELGIFDGIADECNTKIGIALDYYDSAYRLISEVGVESLIDKAKDDVERIEALRDEIDDVCYVIDGEHVDSERLEAVLENVANLKMNTLRAAKEEQETYNEINESVKALRGRGKKIIDHIKEKYYNRSFAEYDDEMKCVYEDTVYFNGLVAKFEEIYSNKKQERNIFDFDDIMHYAIKILNSEMVGKEFRERFDFIFIDEFQDSNILQEKIVDAIKRNNNLFMVGDVKQSIYRFRLADPEIFKRKYHEYSKDNKESVKIDLNNNFRSKRRVTETINDVFDANMYDYNEESRLHCSVPSEDEGYVSRLNIIDWENEKDIKEDKVVLEAEIAVKRIRESLGQMIYDVKKGIQRPVEYRDIVILSRNRTTLSTIERHLLNAGIPTYSDENSGYFESLEIQIFLNLLKVIDNSRRDVPLISVMNSVIFGFTPKEMAIIRIKTRRGGFYDAVKEYAKDGVNEKLRNKINNMLDKLNYWKTLLNTISLEEMVRVLIYDTGYYDYCSGLPAGRQRVLNLRMLMEKAAEFENSNYTGLYGFLEYVEAMRRNNVTVGEARLTGENENVVRIMTVHKSKGLEFPIVILMGAGRKISYKSTGNAVVMHKEMLPALSIVNKEENWHRKSLAQRYIDILKADESYEEEIRILYVAMTRAVDKLEIIASIDKLSSIEELKERPTSYLEMIYHVFKYSKNDIIDAIKPSDIELAREESYEGRKERFIKLLSGISKTNDEELYSQVDEMLSFDYLKDRPLTAVKSKYSVSELNNTEKKKEHTVRMIKPDFSKTEEERNEIKARDIGTAMHLIMEKLDFSKAAEEGKAYIEEVAEKLTLEGSIGEDEAKAINLNMITAFFETEIGKRAAKAPYIEKEREFLLKKEIEGEETIVQGIIDCYFEDEKGLVLIDYKNVYMRGSVDEDVIMDRYKGQIELYAEALSAAEGKPVTEKYLYLFKQKKFLKAL